MPCASAHEQSLEASSSLSVAGARTKGPTRWPGGAPNGWRSNMESKLFLTNVLYCFKHGGISNMDKNIYIYNIQVIYTIPLFNVI
jgi:hypothetical protein